MLLAVVLDVLDLDVEVVVVTACAGCLLQDCLMRCFTAFALDVQLLVVFLLLLVVVQLFHLLVNLLFYSKSLLFFGVLTVVLHSLLLFSCVLDVFV